MKFHNFNVAENESSGIRIQFDVDDIRGSSTVVEAFEAGKDFDEGRTVEGIVGVVEVATKIYSWIKAGKNK